MSSTRGERIEELFEHCLELVESLRAAYLQEQCRSDPDLRTEVEELLLHHAAVPDHFLQDPLVELRSYEPLIDGYRIIERIGEGGMGEVYLAEQTTPLRRPVALKLIKVGMDTKTAIARFEAERQALAVMDHPNIARVFDAGTSQNGRPYFVMEYVPGVAITDYCDSHSLDIIQRLELLIRVCEAVQHAHQKGIIHRDLKPSNVLVALPAGSSEPLPKVIDFGIARAINQQLTERTIFTEVGKIIASPEYMSPEQAKLTDCDIDLRTDVYSLGVLLYELLVGVTPFDRKQLCEAGYVEMLRIIREVDPPTPSARLTKSGELSTDFLETRQMERLSFVRHLRHELDWVVMKAIEKDRTRRFSTASELAADLSRFLRGERVSARPPTLWYKISRAIKRNRRETSLVGGTLIIVISCVFSWRLLLPKGNSSHAVQAHQNKTNLGTPEWAEIRVQVPPGCDGRAIAFDSLREETIVFSGAFANSETSAWDGSTWTLKATTGPSSRHYAGTAYDSSRDRIVLFGGRLNERIINLQDTWEWNGTKWSLVDDGAGPSSPW